MHLPRPARIDLLEEGAQPRVHRLQHVDQVAAQVLPQRHLLPQVERRGLPPADEAHRRVVRVSRGHEDVGIALQFGQVVADGGLAGAVGEQDAGVLCLLEEVGARVADAHADDQQRQGAGEDPFRRRVAPAGAAHGPPGLVQHHSGQQVDERHQADGPAGGRRFVGHGEHGHAGHGDEPGHVEEGKRAKEVAQGVGQAQDKEHADDHIQEWRAGQVVQRRGVARPIEHEERLAQVAPQRLVGADSFHVAKNGDVPRAAEEDVPVLQHVHAQRQHGQRRRPGEAGQALPLRQGDKVKGRQGDQFPCLLVSLSPCPNTRHRRVHQPV